jgi:probable FeS assembly SUF system protein SufT
MHHHEKTVLQRDVNAAIVPVGTRVILTAGSTAYITQALGSAYTVVVEGNMYRIEDRDADALGKEARPPASPASSGALTGPELEQRVWHLLRTCYDPEIPVNIVELGLVYRCEVRPVPGSELHRVDITMTLTAPGCGMGPVLQQEIQHKVMEMREVAEVNVELVWDPPWNQAMMTEAAKLELGLL